ncbi:annexin A7-like isoform X2 [Parasteatoda tepidariorum]|uniref:annexin A7-like isoform X1 n=1 Tax=Parasteatoda tepidariorum TaxID=114398 RepID=UPI00077FE2B2|nr:annexin A7-like isoform X1 [Parasteatoda tepidariorum]XP_015926511.1 annexin A7-like isoform X2 [Parasteatoda tepidariorum]
MNQFLILIALGVVFANAEEPFSIGLGTLSPSYSQTVGKENVKVQFDQKENGAFSYSVGDPSGSNSFLQFGDAAHQAAPAGYAAPSQYAAPAPAGYGAPAQAGYGAPAQAGYAAPAPTGYNGQMPAYNGANNFIAPAHGYQGYGGPAPQAGYFGNNGFQAAARKPEESGGGILPAGFSYHATDGQSFLGSMGESKTFMVEDSQESARGPAETSFFDRKPGLVNGLVGYGPGGARGGLQIGGYAGPQYQGAHKEHGGHE